MCIHFKFEWCLQHWIVQIKKTSPHRAPYIKPWARKSCAVEPRRRTCCRRIVRRRLWAARVSREQRLGSVLPIARVGVRRKRDKLDWVGVYVVWPLPHTPPRHKDSNALNRYIGKNLLSKSQRICGSAALIAIKSSVAFCATAKHSYM